MANAAGSFDPGNTLRHILEAQEQWSRVARGPAVAMAATQQERADWLAEEELREEMHGFITEKMPTLTEPRARLRPDQPTTTS